LNNTFKEEEVCKKKPVQNHGRLTGWTQSLKSNSFGHHYRSGREG
jgi:hypothetical protein